MIKMKKPLK